MQELQAATPVFSAAELWSLFLHFLTLSLLSVGGAMATASDMHRFLVDEKAWLHELQFTSSIAIAQAAPGPNVLFVAVLGWNAAGPAGAFAALTGILLPSSLLVLAGEHLGLWSERRPGFEVFTQAMAPITLALFMATAWFLAEPLLKFEWVGGLDSVGLKRAALMASLLVATVVTVLKSRISPIWLIAVGGVAGACFGQ